MKGIILAGGSGTRLYPITIATSKQLLPVYDKPMIYYPLSTLMMGGIRDILIITTPQDIDNYKSLLKDGSDFGISISYAIQPSPDGLAQAFIIGEKFINNQPCAMILGDNIFHGNNNYSSLLVQASIDAKNGISTIFGHAVPDPQRFGVVEIDSNGRVISIEEKPESPKSNYCVTGLYFYSSDVCDKAKNVKPSSRGELEITDLNKQYLEEKKLKVQLLDTDFKWWDTGTFDSLLDASIYMHDKTVESGNTICSPEAIAFKNGWIPRSKMEELANKYSKNSYGKNISTLLV